MQKIKAALIGATGLVGSHLLRLLLDDPRISQVQVFGRRSVGFQHPKLEEHVIDFREIGKWGDLIRADVAFSALGTTRAQVKGFAAPYEAQYEVDVTFQLLFAEACARRGVGNFALVSAVNADASSRIPYPRMKGVLEEKVRHAGFRNTWFLRPGPLRGRREKRRPLETLTIPLLSVVSRLPGLKGLHPVRAEQVARVAIDCVLDRAHPPGVVSASVIVHS